MTAEIAILNRQGIAMAADSAVSEGEKIFPSANKIFTLSKYQPVGIMIYGSARFMQIPWETVIKVYREELGQQSFDTVSDYGNHFLHYLRESDQFGSKDLSRSYAYETVHDQFEKIAKNIRNEVKRVLDEFGPLSDDAVKQLAKGVIEGHREYWQSVDEPTRAPENFKDYVLEQYKPLIVQAKDDLFEGLLTSVSSRWLTDIGVNAILKFPPDPFELTSSGIVIGGFGENQIFPAITSYHIHAQFGDYLKCKKDRSQKIDSETSASVMPFAQGEMVSMFMEGIAPDYKQTLEAFMRDLLVDYPDAILDALEEHLDDEDRSEIGNRLRQLGGQYARLASDELEKYRQNSYVQPIVHVVSMLPKDKLGEVAESLVNITSFKRQVSPQAETVAEPIDVAVITKGDGFVWLERKHYFDPDLNHHFFENYFRQGEASEQDREGSED